MIYFIQAGRSGPIKIGYSRSWGGAVERLHALQTGNPSTLRIIGRIAGGTRKEKELHDKYKRHCIRDEWFRPVKGIFREINDKPDMNDPIIRDKIVLLDLTPADLRLMGKKAGVNLPKGYDAVKMYNALQMAGILQ